MAHDQLVLLRQRRGHWYLEWSERGRRYRRSIRRSAGTQEEAERIRQSADDALRARLSVAVHFERSRAPKAAQIKAASFGDVEAYLPMLYRETRKGALRRGIEWTLSLDDLGKMLAETGGVCAVSGVPFDLLYRPNKRRPFAPSIDRIECPRPYSLENCRLVCVAVNLAMNEWGATTLERIAMSMSQFMPPARVRR